MLPDTREKPHEGGICREQFTQKDVTGHMSPPVREKSLNCGICKKTFTRKNYAVHLLAHIGGKFHECGTCKKKFLQKSLLAEHLKSHTEQKLEGREACEQMSKDVVLKHLSAQKEENSNECGICYKKFTCKSSVTRHLLIHTRENASEGGLHTKNMTERNQVVQQHPTRVVENSLVCGICGKEFASRRNVKRHLLTHKGEKDLVCGICFKKFSCKSSVTRHLLTHTKGHKGGIHSQNLADGNQVVKLSANAGENPRVCGICGKKFASRRNVKRHLLIHAKEKAKEGMHARKVIESQQVAKILPLHTGENSHVCGLCGKEFASRRNVTRHIRIHTKENALKGGIHIKSLTERNQIGKMLPTHTGKKSDTCGICGKKFSCKRSVTRHLLIHMREKGSVGVTHSNILMERNQVVRQLSTHIGENSHVCGICGKKFSSRRNVKRHLLIHTKEKAHKDGMHTKNLTENQVAKHPISTDENLHVCGVCGKKFSSRKNVKRHLLIHTKEKAHKGGMHTTNLTENQVVKQLPTSTGENLHVCGICGKKFSSTRNVKRHLLIHTKEKAHKGGMHLKNLTETQVAKQLPTSTDENLHVCGICGKKFSSRRNVKRHLLIHAKEKAHKDGMHTKNLTERNQVIQQSIHSGDNSHVCGKEFASRRNVKRHLLIHTKEKAHVGGMHVKKVAAGKDVARHMPSHSGGTHECGMCGKEFTRKSSVTRHLLTHSGKKSHERGICGKNLSQESSSVLTHTEEKSTSVEWKMLNSHVKVVLEDISSLIQNPTHVEHLIKNSCPKIIVEDHHSLVRGNQPSSQARNHSTGQMEETPQA